MFLEKGVAGEGNFEFLQCLLFGNLPFFKKRTPLGEIEAFTKLRIFDSLQKLLNFWIV